MPSPIGPEAEKLFVELQEGTADLESTAAALDMNKAALGDVASRRAGVISEHTEAVKSETEAYSARIAESYDFRLRSVLTAALGGEESRLMEADAQPDIEKVIAFDETIRRVAGQPITVLHKDRDWFDIARLSSPDRHDSHGLQMTVMRGHYGKIEFNTDGVLTLLKESGKEADRYHDSILHERSIHDQQRASSANPDVDPLTARIVLPGQQPAEESEDETLVLVGYTHLLRTLNGLYAISEDDAPLDRYAKVLGAAEIGAKLKNLGLTFNTDYLDGHLAEKISRTREELDQMDGRSQSDSYLDSVLVELQNIRARLVSAGWISR